MNKHFLPLLGAALLIAVPTIALLPGCGGGDGGLLQSNTPASQTYRSNLQLSSGQTAALTLKVTGTVANGTLVVPNSSRNRLSHGSSNLLSAAVAAGTYPVAGAISAPNGFNVSGSFPSPLGDFSIAGQLPVSNGNGNYTLTVGGETTNGSFISTTPTTGPLPTSTATPSVTAVPGPVGNDGSIQLSVLSSLGANFGASRFDTNNVAVLGTQTQSGRGGFRINSADASGRALKFSSIGLDWPKYTLQVGQTFKFDGFFDSLTVTSGDKTWSAGGVDFTNSTAGTLSVTSIQGTTVVLEAKNLVVSNGRFTSNPTTLTLNGNFTVQIPVAPTD